MGQIQKINAVIQGYQSCFRVTYNGADAYGSDRSIGNQIMGHSDGVCTLWFDKCQTHYQWAVVYAAVDYPEDLYEFSCPG